MQLVRRLLSLHDLLSALFHCPRLGCCLLQLFFQVSDHNALLPLHTESRWFPQNCVCYTRQKAQVLNASHAIGAATRSQPAVLPSEPRPPQWLPQLRES